MGDPVTSPVWLQKLWLDSEKVHEFRRRLPEDKAIVFLLHDPQVHGPFDHPRNHATANLRR